MVFEEGFVEEGLGYHCFGCVACCFGLLWVLLLIAHLLCGVTRCFRIFMNSWFKSDTQRRINSSKTFFIIPQDHLWRNDAFFIRRSALVLAAGTELVTCGNPKASWPCVLTWVVSDAVIFSVTKSYDLWPTCDLYLDLVMTRHNNHGAWRHWIGFFLTHLTSHQSPITSHIETSCLISTLFWCHDVDIILGRSRKAFSVVGQLALTNSYLSMMTCDVLGRCDVILTAACCTELLLLWPPIFVSRTEEQKTPLVCSTLETPESGNELYHLWWLQQALQMHVCIYLFTFSFTTLRHLQDELRHRCRCHSRQWIDRWFPNKAPRKYWRRWSGAPIRQ